jgi:adenylate cyclase
MGFRTIPHVLLVDDNPIVLEPLERNLALENPNWHISTASSYESACEILRAEHPVNGPVDVILTDLVMGSDLEAGMKVIQAAKLHDPLMMVLLFTAKEKTVNRNFALELGAFDCIEKTDLDDERHKEMSLKAKVALQFRELALAVVEDRKQMAVLERYFDSMILGVVRNDPSLLEARPRRVTVVFWDIRGFSQLCEDLKEKPHLLEGFLLDYYNASAEVIFQHGGVLDKFIGDGVMALFGALADRTNDSGLEGLRKDATNAAEAALALRKRFNELMKAWTEKWRLALIPKKLEGGLGCGIHTGEALVGSLGTRNRDQFTAIGAHVNLAARVQGLSKGGQILVTQTTRTILPEQYDLAEVDTVENIKGIQGKYVIFELKGNLLEKRSVESRVIPSPSFRA